MQKEPTADIPVGTARLRPSTAPVRIGAVARVMGITTTAQRTETAALIRAFLGLLLFMHLVRFKPMGFNMERSR